MNLCTKIFSLYEHNKMNLYTKIFSLYEHNKISSVSIIHYVIFLILIVKLFFLFVV